jgi:hypothetical protein
MVRYLGSILVALFFATTLHAQGALENPASAQIQSGIGVVSGWNCKATKIEIQIDEGPRTIAPLGSSRGDTATICGGKSDTGFSLLLNYNLVGPGPHKVRAYADGAAVPFGESAFTVVTPGVEFLRGVSGVVQAYAFPQSGTDAFLQWQESKQNFVIAGYARAQTPAELLVGTYTIERLFGWDATGVYFDTLGRATVAGTLTVTPTTISRTAITVGGAASLQPFTGIAYTDDGTRMRLQGNNQSIDYITAARGDRLIFSYKAFDSAEVDTFVWRRTRTTAADDTAEQTKRSGDAAIASGIATFVK